MGSKRNGVSHEPIITDVDYVDTDCKLLRLQMHFKLAVQVHSKSIFSSAQYVTLEKYFSHPSLVIIYLIFQAHP
jgi:hypothetical protein